MEVGWGGGVGATFESKISQKIVPLKTQKQIWKK